MRAAASIAWAIVLAAGCAATSLEPAAPAPPAQARNGPFNIEIAPVGGAAFPLDGLARFLAECFGCDVSVAAQVRAPESVGRRALAEHGVQLRAEDLVAFAREGQPAGVASLVVTDMDLYADAPEGRPLDYVFGVAEVGGFAAVVSTSRLGLRYAGEPAGASPELRLMNVAIHELGHAFGLGHCDNPDCAMRPVATVEELDRRPAALCAACRAALALFGGGSAQGAGLAPPGERR